MIFTAIFDIFYFVVSLLISPITLLSDVSLSGSIATSIATASGYLSGINAFIPIDTMIEILGVSLLFESYYLAYKLVMWIVKKIPTIN